MAKQNLIIRGGFDGTGITKGLTKAQTSLNGFQRNVGKTMKLIGLSLGSLAVGSLIKSTTKMAMAVESSMDNIERNMGKSSQIFNNWAQNQSKSWGIARLEAYKYGSTFSNLLGSFQDDTKQTADSTEELMKATAIISSKTGRTFEDTANRIRSGMLGSTEAIEDLGVYTQVSMLESTEAFKKFANGRTWAQLDFKVQQQIRLAAILEQTYARYGNELANTTQTKQAKFLATLQNIKLNLGQAFLPIYNVVLPALTTLGNILENITGKISALSQAFFGKSISVQTTAVQDSASAISDYGDATEKAGKQARKAFAGIDEITTLTKNSSKGGSGGSSSGGTTTSPTTTTTVVDKDTGFTKWLDKIGDSIEPTKKALGRLMDALNPLGGLVFNNLKSLYNDTLKPIGKWVLGEGLPRLLDVGTSLLKNINWDKLSSALTNLNQAIEPFTIKVGEGLILFIESLADIMKPIVSTTTDLLAKALDALARAIKAIPEDVAIAIGGAIGGLATAVLLFKGATAVAGIAKGIGVGISGMLTAISAHPVMAIATGIGAVAGAIMSLNKHKFKESDVGKYVGKLKDLIDTSDDLNRALKDGIEQRKENAKNVKKEYGAIEILADRYFDLADSTNLSNDQQLLMKTYADELVKKIPKLSGLIDEQTGAYKGTKDQIQEVITKTKEYYLVQAAQEDLIKIAEDLYDANKNIKTITTERNTAVTLLTQKEKLLDEAMEAAYGTAEEYDKWQKENKTSASKLNTEVTNLKSKINELDGQIDTSTDTQKNLNSEWDYATDYISTYSDTAKKGIKEVEKAVANADSQFKKTDISGNSKQMVKDFKGTFDKDKTASSSLKTWLDGISSTVRNYKLPTLTFNAKVDTDNLFSGMRRNLSNYLPSAKINGYATGGFPSVGELFVGNENGIEMMGRMGNQNVVANNKQITEGIKQAVIEAMMISGGQNGGNITVESKLFVDSEELYSVTQKGKASHDRRFNTLATT